MLTMQEIAEIERRVNDPLYGRTATDGATKDADMRRDLRTLIAFVRSIGWPGTPGTPGHK